MKNDSSLILNLDTQATALENELHEHLLAYPPGIYMAGRENPILKPGGQYHTHKKGENSKIEQVPVSNFDDIVDTVYDIDGVMMIPRHVAVMKQRMLSVRPNVPVFGRRLIAAYLGDHLTRVALYEVSRRPVLLPAEYELICSQTIEYDDFRAIVIDHSSILRDQMYDFTDHSSWNIYHTKRAGNQFTITNGGDWRIADWERIQSEKENRSED